MNVEALLLQNDGRNEMKDEKMNKTKENE